MDRGAGGAVAGVAESGTAGATTHAHTLWVGLVRLQTRRAQRLRCGASPCPADRATCPARWLALLGAAAGPGAAQSASSWGLGFRCEGCREEGASAPVPVRFGLLTWMGLVSPPSSYATAVNASLVRCASSSDRQMQQLANRQEERLPHPFIHPSIINISKFPVIIESESRKHAGALPFSLSQEVST